MMLYRTIDWYDGYPETLYEGSSLTEAQQAREQRYIDTDDEADVVIDERSTGEDGKLHWYHMAE